MTKYITLLFLLISGLTQAQVANVPAQENLQKLYQQFRAKEILDSTHAQNLAKTGNVKVVEITEKGDLIGLVGFDLNGFPVFYSSDNADAAATVGTNLVVAGAANGYGLTGNGMVIGEWDGGSVRGTHQELTGRVTQVDNPSSNSDHATHVAGTMIASGIDADAKGMATAATISAHDFFSDDSEMTTFSSTGLISNHSYGRITGWREMTNGDWRWYGDTSISGVEDYMFGFYSNNARSWDLIANAAPDYLIVKSAGNDRNDEPPASVNSHFIFVSGSWVASTVSRPGDGGAVGYDCISSAGNAKNILTVGAVGDITNGWSQPSDVNMSSFSGWGPTDDGRIKPDIVANGVSLYSTGSNNNTDYYSSSGTSMSAPNATGSMALLQEMYNDSNSTFMNASSLKALVIHTANEAGLAGPDFKFGWGLLNTKGAADIIADTTSNKIIEASLANNTPDVFTFYSDGTTDIEATIVWNDPAHTVPAAALDPSTAMLVNDLDLRIADGSGTIKLPWIVNGAMPSMAATRGDNVKDNVEHVIFDAPAAGNYTFTISHKGNLGSNQNYSLIISGVAPQPTGPIPVASFTSTATSICEGDSVVFTDTSTGSPTSLEWTFAGGTPNTSNSPTPLITYASAGSYEVKLKAINANGVDSIVQTNFVTVTALPVITTSPLQDVCFVPGLITLSGASPAGGVWTGNGVINGAFDPMVAGVGIHTLTYTVTNGACTSSSTEDIEVVLTTTPVFPAFTASFCDNSTPFLLAGATPTGGTYSGPGVTNNVFDPASAGLGAHTITYTYVNSGGCSGTATTSINVLPGVATSLGSFSDICENASILNLSGGTPSGGYYTGIGVDTVAGTFNPGVAGVGTHTITYFGSGGLCLSAATSTITVNAPPIVAFGALSDACISTSSVTLSGGTPVGGTYTGLAVTNGVFDPSTAGLGLHVMYYSYTDANMCTTLDSSSINVVNSIQYAIMDTSVCENSTAFAISTGIPLGGTYSGTGVVGNTFDPSIAGVGTHIITYTDATNNCANAGTATFTVTANPSVSLSPFSTICLSGGPVNLTGGSPLGGTYSGIGVTNNILDPLVNGIGTVDITYTVTASGCSNSTVQTATIGSGSPEITNINTSYCVNENSLVLIGNPTGGTYSGSGVVDSIFDPNAAGVGMHTITYATTGGCAGSTSYMIQVNAKPIVGSVSGPLISSQNTVAGYNIAAQNGAFYNWVATGGTIVSNSNNQITVKWDNAAVGSLQVAIFDQNGCSDTTNITVELWPVGIDEVSENMEVHFYPNPVTETINFEAEINTSKQLELVVLNVVGQELYRQTRNVSKGYFNWPVDVSAWGMGSYFFVLQDKGEVLFKGQFLKQ